MPLRPMSWKRIPCRFVHLRRMCAWSAVAVSLAGATWSTIETIRRAS
jgi:hypothetical protein